MEHWVKSPSLGQLETVSYRTHLSQDFEWPIELGTEFRDWPFAEKVLLEPSNL